MPVLEPAVDEEAMVRVAVAAVDRKCESDDDQHVEDAVRRHVHELFGAVAHQDVRRHHRGPEALEELRGERAA
jgi:S-adenosylmethionine synthetase